MADCLIDFGDVAEEPSTPQSKSDSPRSSFSMGSNLLIDMLSDGNPFDAYPVLKTPPKVLNMSSVQTENNKDLKMVVAKKQSGGQGPLAVDDSADLKDKIAELEAKLKLADQNNNRLEKEAVNKNAKWLEYVKECEGFMHSMQNTLKSMTEFIADQNSSEVPSKQAEESLKNSSKETRLLASENMSTQAKGSVASATSQPESKAKNGEHGIPTILSSKDLALALASSDAQKIIGVTNGNLPETSTEKIVIVEVPHEKLMKCIDNKASADIRSPIELSISDIIEESASPRTSLSSSAFGDDESTNVGSQEHSDGDPFFVTPLGSPSSSIEELRGFTVPNNNFTLEVIRKKPEEKLQASSKTGSGANKQESAEECFPIPNTNKQQFTTVKKMEKTSSPLDASQTQLGAPYDRMTTPDVTTASKLSGNVVAGNGQNSSAFNAPKESNKQSGEVAPQTTAISKTVPLSPDLGNHAGSSELTKPTRDLKPTKGPESTNYIPSSDKLEPAKAPKAENSTKPKDVTTNKDFVKVAEDTNNYKDMSKNNGNPKKPLQQKEVNTPYLATSSTMSNGAQDGSVHSNNYRSGNRFSGNGTAPNVGKYPTVTSGSSKENILKTGLQASMHAPANLKNAGKRSGYVSDLRTQLTQLQGLNGQRTGSPTSTNSTSARFQPQNTFVSRRSRPTFTPYNPGKESVFKPQNKVTRKTAKAESSKEPVSVANGSYMADSMYFSVPIDYIHRSERESSFASKLCGPREFSPRKVPKIIIEGLPSDISLPEVTGSIRGGTLHSVRLLPSSSGDGISQDAEVCFVQPEHAEAFLNMYSDKKFEIVSDNRKDASFSVKRGGLYMMSYFLFVEIGINSATRVLQLHGLSKDWPKEKIAEALLRRCNSYLTDYPKHKLSYMTLASSVAEMVENVWFRPSSECKQPGDNGWFVTCTSIEWAVIIEAALRNTPDDDPLRRRPGNRLSTAQICGMFRTDPCNDQFDNNDDEDKENYY